MDVHLDHAGIGGHADHVQARVVRGRIALDMDLQVQAQGRGLDRVQQVQVFLQRGDRRHEHAQPPVLGFHGQRGADGSLQFPIPGAGHLGDDILARRAGHEARPRLSPAVGRDLARPGQGRAVHRGVGRVDIGIIRFRQMRQRGQRQAIPDRAVAGHKKDMAPAQMPAFRIPPQPGLALPGLDGQHETRGRGQAAVKDGGQAMARLGVGQFAVLGGDIAGQVGFLDQPFRRILECR